MVRRLAPLAVVALAALASCDSSSNPGSPDSCGWSQPGAPWLAFSSRRSGSYDVYVVRADGTCEAQVTSDPAQDWAPSFGPGRRIAYATDRGGVAAIRLHDLATAQDWPLDVGSLASATLPAFSPDGSRIAFEGRRPDSPTTDVYVVPAAGGDPVALTTSDATDTGPTWGPDGATSIYFVSSRDGPYDVYAVPASGGAATRVTTGSRIIGKPAVAPDGRALFYARTISPASSLTEIVRHPLPAGPAIVVTSEQDSQPAPSPAGDRLAVRSSRSGQADLLVVDAADGGRVVRITDDAASDGDPSFAPAR